MCKRKNGLTFLLLTTVTGRGDGGEAKRAYTLGHVKKESRSSAAGGRDILLMRKDQVARKK